MILDVMVTGIGDARKYVENAEKFVERAFGQCADDDAVRSGDDLHCRSRVRMIYYRVSAHELAESNVTGEEWLLDNVSTAPYVCHLRYCDMMDGTVSETTVSNGVSALIARAAKEQWLEHHAHTFSRRSLFDAYPDECVDGVIDVYEQTPRETVDSMNGTHRHIRFTTNIFHRKPRMALLVPMTLKGVANPKQPVPIVSVLAAALHSNFSHVDMDRGLYLGIDDDEDISAKHMEQIRQRFERQMRVSIERVVRLPAVWRYEENGPLKMYNCLFRHAMMDGYDFAAQLQDDARPETPMWDKILGSYICKNASGIGAYAMTDRYEPTRVRNMVVGRAHFDIFGVLVREDVVDVTRWVLRVLENYSKIVGRVVVTNTIRDMRRRMNGTLVRRSPYDKHTPGELAEIEEQIISRDRQHFLETITPVLEALKRRA